MAANVSHWSVVIHPEVGRCAGDGRFAAGTGASLKIVHENRLVVSSPANSRLGVTTSEQTRDERKDPAVVAGKGD